MEIYNPPKSPKFLGEPVVLNEQTFTLPVLDAVLTQEKTKTFYPTTIEPIALIKVDNLPARGAQLEVKASGVLYKPTIASLNVYLILNDGLNELSFCTTNISGITGTSLDFTVELTATYRGYNVTSGLYEMFFKLSVAVGGVSNSSRIASELVSFATLNDQILSFCLHSAADASATVTFQQSRTMIYPND